MCAGPPPNCHEGRLGLFTRHIKPLFEPQFSEAKSYIASADHTTVPMHMYKKDKPFTFSQASKKSQGSALVGTQLNMFLNPSLFRA